MKRIAVTSLVVCAVLAMSVPVLAQEAESPKVSTTDLGGGLFVLSGAGGNSLACTAPSGVLLVDTGYGPMSGPLRSAVEALIESPVRTVVNTHWHLDHVAGNEAFSDEGSLIVAHHNVRKHMSAPQRLEVLDREVPASSAGSLPTLTFDEQLTLYCGDQKVSLLHPPPAHTDGDVVLVFEPANLIHAGDIFFNCGYPFIDIAHGGSIDGMIGAVRWILERADADTRIVPGHGPVASRSDLETYLEMLQGFRDAVAREAAEGRSLDETIAAKLTAALDERWGGVFFSPEQFTEMVYRSLPDPQ